MGDHTYLVMERIDGPSLEEVVKRRGKLTESEAAAAIHDILQVSPGSVYVRGPLAAASMN